MRAKASSTSSNGDAIAIGAAAVLAAGVVVVMLVEVGPLSAHMLHHIAIMNVLAPLFALAIAVRAGALPSRAPQGGHLWLAAGLQLLVLVAWHLPATQRWGTDAGARMLLLQAPLFAAAVYFWSAITTLATAQQWQAILALLVTGKIACLLGSLLIFAPRLLTLPTGTSQHGAHAVAMLADQQLAGLLMIVACPLSYLLVGVVIAAHMLRDLARTETSRNGRVLSWFEGR
jgi:putative membrane protein